MTYRLCIIQGVLFCLPNCLLYITADQMWRPLKLCKRKNTYSRPASLSVDISGLVAKHASQPGKILEICLFFSFIDDSLTNFTLMRMSHHRNQKTLNQSLQTFPLSSILDLISLLTPSHFYISWYPLDVQPSLFPSTCYDWRHQFLVSYILALPSLWTPLTLLPSPPDTPST